MHLFAGAGGGLLADLILGHTPVVAVEWEPYPCQVLRERAAEGWFPELVVWEGDVRDFDPSEYTGSVDCIHAGFPCQDISTAGKQAGVGEGTRSGLYREVLRIAGTVRPRFIFLENVAAIKSNGLETVVKDLAVMGYDCRWLCIRASDVGATHHRDRWFGLAYADDRWLQGGRSSANASKDVPIGGRISTDGTSNIGSTKATVLAYTNGTQFPRRGIPSGTHPQHTHSIGQGWWETEPTVGRVANGVAHQSHRLKAIGNGQVPLQVAAAFAILAAE